MVFLINNNYLVFSNIAFSCKKSTQLIWHDAFFWYTRVYGVLCLYSSKLHLSPGEVCWFGAGWTCSLLTGKNLQMKAKVKCSGIVRSITGFIFLCTAHSLHALWFRCQHWTFIINHQQKLHLHCFHNFSKELFSVT